MVKTRTLGAAKMLHWDRSHTTRGDAEDVAEVAKVSKLTTNIHLAKASRNLMMLRTTRQSLDGVSS